MYKIKAVVFDLTGNALNWLNEFGDEDHMELCEVITLDDDSPIHINDLMNYDNWDVLLVFEDGVRDQIDRLLEKLGVPKNRIIFPMDMHDRNTDVAQYLFRGPVRKLLRYYSYRPEGYRYGISSAEGLTYLNAISDDIILPTMIFEQTNWAKEDMTEFYRLASEYFTFDNDQILFCDIGANIGTTCLYFKKRIDKAVKILAFEPSPQNYRMLCVNALLNEVEPSDHLFVNKGVSDTESTAGFRYKANNPGGSAVVTGTDQDADTVELITFDGFFDSNGIDPGSIKYMWIDVEGFEARFLVGARNVLAQINVPVLMEFVPMFYTDKEGEFDLLMSELERNFSRFICMQDIGKGIMPIGILRNEQENTDIQWDLFLLK